MTTLPVQYIVADPKICHGKWTVRRTRTLVSGILEQLDSGMSREQIVKEWRGDVTLDAIEEVARMIATFWPGARSPPENSS